MPTPFGGGQLLRPHRVLSNRARSLRHSVVSQIKKYTADEPDKINKKKKTPTGDGLGPHGRTDRTRKYLLANPLRFPNRKARVPRPYETRRRSLFDNSDGRAVDRTSITHRFPRKLSRRNSKGAARRGSATFFFVARRS